MEARIDAEFSAESTARSQRVLVRNENKAEQERKRQAEEVEIEQRRQREMLERELREQNELREAEIEQRRQQEQLETEQREQRERLEQEHRRHEEQLNLERERIEEEAAEREASIRKKEATIRAKKIALESFIEENSVGDGSLSLGVTEIAPSEKVEAYVEQPVKFEPVMGEQVNQFELLSGPVTISNSDFTRYAKGVGENGPDNITKSVLTRGTEATGGFHDRYQSYPYKGLPTYTAPTTDLRYAWAPAPVLVACIATESAPKNEPSNLAKWLSKTPVSASITGTSNPPV